MGAARINPLPECTCAGAELCRVHGKRGNVLRTAARAVAAGYIQQEEFDAWLKRYPRTRKKKWNKRPEMG